MALLEPSTSGDGNAEKYIVVFVCAHYLYSIYIYMHTYYTYIYIYMLYAICYIYILYVYMHMAAFVSYKFPKENPP